MIFNIPHLSSAWRIVVGVALVPAFATLYHRLVLPEATRYNKSRNLGHDSVATPEDDIEKKKAELSDSNSESTNPKTEAIAPKQLVQKKKAHFREFAIYMSEWRHLKTLIGTAMCWFLVDVA